MKNYKWLRWCHFGTLKMNLKAFAYNVKFASTPPSRPIRQYLLQQRLFIIIRSTAEYISIMVLRYQYYHPLQCKTIKIGHSAAVLQ